MTTLTLAGSFAASIRAEAQAVCDATHLIATRKASRFAVHPANVDLGRHFVAVFRKVPIGPGRTVFAWSHFVGQEAVPMARSLLIARACNPEQRPHRKRKA